MSVHHNMQTCQFITICRHVSSSQYADMSVHHNMQTCQFITISRWITFRMRRVSDKRFRNIKTNVTFIQFRPPPSNPPENHAVYEMMWKKYGIDRQARDDNRMRRMRIACWKPKATHTYLEYVILIAFSRHQSLLEHDWMPCYTYILWPCW